MEVDEYGRPQAGETLQAFSAYISKTASATVAWQNRYN
jgi:hypothetical protein